MICNKCFGSGIDIENDCYCYRCEGQGEIPDNNRDHRDHEDDGYNYRRVYAE